MSVEYFHFIDVKRLMQQVTPTVTTLGQALPRIQLGGSSSLSLTLSPRSDCMPITLIAVTMSQAWLFIKYILTEIYRNEKTIVNFHCLKYI